MKITKSQLKQLIKEELDGVLQEGPLEERHKDAVNKMSSHMFQLSQLVQLLPDDISPTLIQPMGQINEILQGLAEELGITS